MPKTLIRIGPRDHGRHMSLEDFDQAEGIEGHLYELSRGIVTVTDVPNRWHALMIAALRLQLSVYQNAHPKQIYMLAGGSDCKILLTDLESERHPDLTVYKRPPDEEENVWATWVPDIVVEVISPGSQQRDYVEKREEYLRFGVREYWIIDADRQEMLVLRRSRGRWTEHVIRPPKTYRTRLLPGFRLDCARVFEAGGATT